MSNDISAYSSSQSGKPYKTYKKVVLGRVYVSMIDPFSGQPTGYMLYGDPKRNDESCYLIMWNEIDDRFFRTRNKSHLDAGFIIEVPNKETPEVIEQPLEQYSDEQLKEVINKRYLALQAILNKTSSEAVLFRMIDLAREMEKSEKIIGAIEARLAEVNKLNIVEKKDGSKT